MASQSPQGPLNPVPNPTPPDDDTYNDDPVSPPASRSMPTAMAIVAVAFALLVGWGLRNYMQQNSPQPLPMGPIVSGDTSSDRQDGDSSSAGDNSNDGGDADGASPGKATRRRGKAKMAGSIVVQVAGHVSAPGVYELEPDSRVSDALAAAGGVASDGDANDLNLAAKLKDGERIEVPGSATIIAAPREAPAVTPPGPAPTQIPTAEGKAIPGATSQTIESSVAQPTAAGAAAVVPVSTEKGRKTRKLTAADLTANPVNIATATADELCVLPGVGPGMAARIVAYRTQNGGFHSVEELDKVPGIGPKRMEALRPLITVG